MRSRFLGLVLILGFFSFTPLNAQQWVPVNVEDIPPVGQRDIIPNIYKTYQIDPDELHQVLWSAPQEYAQNLATSATLLKVGMPDGSVDIFKIVRYDMMEAGLAASYTAIRTFRGISISNPYRTLRADWTSDGFRALIRDDQGTIFIDPFQRNDLANRIVYYKKDYTSNRAWDCGVTQSEFVDENESRNSRAGDCLFRSYRLAIATTGEYSNFFGAFNAGQSALVLSQVVTAVNRINEVYETDLTVRLILIANTNAIFYYDPAGDPYSGAACVQLGQNQTTITNVIGSANYDIGHVFSVGSGGCAGLGVICNNSQKAYGATGLNPPTGDGFYIDYVAHELGHQLGADHTFNGTEGSCAPPTRVALSAYEPGSGSTIMAYAGICGSQDIQPHSDAYFHARSLLQIANKLTSTSCAAFITINNQAPVAGSPPNYTIPISTPFVLTAIASDPENDPISYCWEEYDLETTSTEPPAANDIDGPLFRSLTQTVSPNRYFPTIADIVNNTSTIWEVLPSVSRTMNFRMTVRDYHNIAGCTDEDDIVVTSSSTSGPFVVTSQNAATTWLEGSTQTITWNVANTTASPVSCANVDIRLSTDGGFTYPIALSLNEPNDGSATVSIPISATTTGRVMVRGSNNIFFDINNVNITIEANLPNFTIALSPASVSECNDGTVTTTVQIGSFMGFSNPVTLSTLNLPPGSNASFNPAVVIPGNNSMLTISNLTGLFGNYTPTVRGTSTTGNKDAVFSITLLAPPAASPSLTSPANNASDVVITPTLDWQPVAGVTQYEYQVASDNAFNNVVSSGIVSTDLIQITSPLSISQQYFWRTRGINSCGNGAWSTIFNFTTGSCFALNSTNVPMVIPASGTPTVLSLFPNTIAMTITDLNVINLMGNHTWVDDLKFSLISPQGTELLFWNQPCDNDDNFNINFDDEAAPGTWPCPPVNGLTYKPDGLLSAFDGQHADGTWTLKIQDVVNQDGGVLNAWGLKVCGTVSCQLLVNQASGSGPGSLPAAINCAMPGDTVFISSSLAGQTINIGANPITIVKSIVIAAQGANTNVTVSGTRVFNVNSGITFECNGFLITAGTSLTGGAISNTGTMKLKNVNIKRNTMVSGATLIQNNPGGTLNVVGSCNINL